MKSDPKAPKDLPWFMSVAHMIECGLLHSGLPSCCVAFFVTEWTGYDHNQIAAYHAIPGAKQRVGYVRCPRCVARKVIVAVKPCACEAHFNNGEQTQYRKDSGQLVPVPGYPNAWTDAPRPEAVKA